MTAIETRIREGLATLEPLAIDLRDESGLHAGHAGAKEGGHYRLVVVAARFAGKPRIERHRMVYSALDALMKNGIHALALTTLAPAEAAALAMQQ